MSGTPNFHSTHKQGLRTPRVASEQAEMSRASLCTQPERKLKASATEAFALQNTHAAAPPSLVGCPMGSSENQTETRRPLLRDRGRAAKASSVVSWPARGWEGAARSSWEWWHQGGRKQGGEGQRAGPRSSAALGGELEAPVEIWVQAHGCRTT